MSDNKSNIEILEAIRAELVEERRSFARTAYDPASNGAISKAPFLKKLIDTQHDIEVIDRIIADERALAPSVYETRGIREI